MDFAAAAPVSPVAGVCALYIVCLFLRSGCLLREHCNWEYRARTGPACGAVGNWTVSRADIVDRNGDILAKNIMSGHITLRPGHVRNHDAVAELIHSLLPYEYSLADALRLVNSSRRFVYIKKYASDAARAAVKKARLEGLEVEDIQTRRYPKRRLFSHVVGYVNVEGRGMDGAERIFDEYLRENSDPLRLSLDSRVQSVFYEQLSAAMSKYQAKGAMGLLMNSRTGEMVAMVSLPDFDPENRSADPVGHRTFMPMRGVLKWGQYLKYSTLQWRWRMVLQKNTMSPSRIKYWINSDGLLRESAMFAALSRRGRICRLKKSCCILVTRAVRRLRWICQMAHKRSFSTDCIWMNAWSWSLVAQSGL